MTRTNCQNCMWGDKCSTTGECDYYDPLDENHLEAVYDKAAFQKEWSSYIKNWNEERRNYDSY